MKPNVKEFIKGMLIVIGILAVVAGVAYLGGTAQKNRNERIYNNGVCTECGGHYEFISVATAKGISTATYFYYQCDNCGKIIKLHH